MTRLAFLVTLLLHLATGGCCGTASFQCERPPSPRGRRSGGQHVPSRDAVAPLCMAADRRSTNKLPGHLLEHRLASASSRGAVVLIDAENVRGKSGFELTHVQLLDRVVLWANKRGFAGRVSLVVDHGSEPSGFWLNANDRPGDGGGDDGGGSGGGIAVIFSGPGKVKADDVIARDVSFFADRSTMDRDVVVVTADGELSARCRKAARQSGGGNGGGKGGGGRRSLEIVPPVRFLEDLDRVMMDVAAEVAAAGGEDVIGAHVPTFGGMLLADDLDSTTSTDEDDHDAAPLVAELESEIELRGAVVAAEASLRKKHSPKKRRKLRRHLHALREKLAGRRGDSNGGGGRSTTLLDRITAIPPADGNGGAVTTTLLARREQDALLAGWERTNRRRTTGKGRRREQTGDRILLAENFRRRLERIVGNAATVADSAHEEGNDVVEPAEAHARYVNSMRKEVGIAESPPPLPAAADEEQSSSPTKSPLRFVIVSDTHGYEEDLTASNIVPWSLVPQTSSASSSPETTATRDDSVPLLPDGDVLLHLGDFAVDGSSRQRHEASLKFDAWLARQTHETKIVVRGNHDPVEFDFPTSNATYVSTSPTLVDLNGWTISLVPYRSSGFSRSKRGGQPLRLPPCDLLASHEPPRAILDRCSSGALAGSASLRSAVERMSGGNNNSPPPPRLWVCGHIHEGRGMRRVRFGAVGTRETIVVNAANANPGRASAIVHGPTILELSNTMDENKMLQLCEQEQPSSTISGWGRLGGLASANGVQNGVTSDGVGKLLLAVDLGLRTGVSLFNDQGVLLRYDHFHFSSAEELSERASRLIDKWEEDANDFLIRRNSTEDHDVIANNDCSVKWRISHVAIEGGDRLLWDAWIAAVQRPDLGADPHLLSISPQEWRARLLTAKEKASSATAKAAARLVARQVVGDFGTMGKHDGKFKTDVAESIVMGYYVANKLGWATREPLVRRYSNNAVIVPSKKPALV